MLVLSISSLIEESMLGGQGVDRLSGNVLDPDRLFDVDSLRALEEAHSGVFGFLAFDPRVDDVVSEYLLSGTLAVDSGPRLLVLFTVATQASVPTVLTRPSLSWINLDESELPARRLVREVFESLEPPPLPGLLMFESFTNQADILYFELGSAEDVGELRDRLRGVYGLADHLAASESVGAGRFNRTLAVEAQRRRLAFRQAGRASMRVRFIRTYQMLGDNAGDIVAALGLIPMG